MLNTYMAFFSLYNISTLTKLIVYCSIIFWYYRIYKLKAYTMLYCFQMYFQEMMEKYSAIYIPVPDCRM